MLTHLAGGPKIRPSARMSYKLYTNNNNGKRNNGWIQHNGSQTKETNRRMLTGMEYLRVYLQD